MLLSIISCFDFTVNYLNDKLFDPKIFDFDLKVK